MSTHSTILGDMIRNETAPEEEKTSLDVERDIGLSPGTEQDKPQPGGERPAGQRRQRIESE